MNDTHLCVDRLIEADLQTVFDCWTSSDSLAQWHCGTVASCVMELEVGGEFRIEFEPEENCDHAVVRGKYLELNPPHRLQYSWQWDGAESDPSVVTVDFSEVGPEATKIQVTHESLATEKLRSDHEQGWNACLDGLQVFVKSAS